MNMRIISHRILPLALGILLPFVGAQAQVLANVAGLEVTSKDLDVAIASSPIAVQFPSMDPDVQAGLRGDMLKRLVAQRLLLLEAQRQGLDKTSDYLKDAEDYRKGYLYRTYMDKVREGIKIDEAKMAEWHEQYKGEHDAIEAAKSQEIAERYKLLKTMNLEFLKQKYHLQVFEEKIAAGTSPKTVLAKADGYQLTMGQLYHGSEETYNQKDLEEKLYQKLELELVARAAQDDGIEAPMQRYAEDALPSLLMAKVEKRWIPDEAAMRNYFDSHKTIGEIPERRHVVQVVVATREEAEALRQQIDKGEATIYQVAAKNSIDPYGRKQAGDMGWLPAGSGMPEIESAIAKLKDGELSGVIKTSQGYHLVMIAERTPMKQRNFDGVKDRVRQAMVNENYPGYLSELQKRFPVKWGIPMATNAESAEKLINQ